MRQFLATERPLKIMKKAFYFTLKVLFLFKIFKYLSWLFGHIENRLDWMTRSISKSITSQPGKQTITKHILPNIWRSKSDQRMKFGQLKEYNMRNTFLEKSCTQYGGKIISRPFSQKPKFNISLDEQLKFLCSLLLFYFKFGAIKKYWN